MTCEACGGFVQREPASVTCLLCGRWGPILDAVEEARLAQRVRDWMLRPRSAECLPEFDRPAAPLVPHPGAGWLKLPGTPTQRPKIRLAR